MSFALVGSVGSITPTSGTGGATVSPAWGTGEFRTAGNLLVCWCIDCASVTIPTTPAGWSVAKSISPGTDGGAAIFYKIATGGDAAPTISGSSRLYAQLAEFAAGAGTVISLDQTGSVDSGGGTTTTATAAG